LGGRGGDCFKAPSLLSSAEYFWVLRLQNYLHKYDLFLPIMFMWFVILIMNCDKGLDLGFRINQVNKINMQLCVRIILVYIDLWCVLRIWIKEIYDFVYACVINWSALARYINTNSEEIVCIITCLPLYPVDITHRIISS
jgi:hypothetical protein